MDIIDMARASGITVILDGRIGREEYQSVCGSLSALQRFADAVRHCEAPSDIRRRGQAAMNSRTRAVHSSPGNIQE
ncbi:hypothetical protein [Paraburkholderia lacunae]|uniref:Uncharacterized protein n=1 Tax=Paraburkholderia lacunae TaxID=2211104 RepID=A0A370NCI7_9BURK|nr:hypothetical protein [Paraburkholderia lacunae]RDK03310.1 hypothetical protein DLM46_07160 [Paraburkholderia lacunae]